MSETKHVGGCLCGAIRYEACQAPVFTALCHCRMCQQWSGSAMLATATFDQEAVAFTAGEPKVHWSSQVMERGFCGDCGSSLFTRYVSGGVLDGLISISLGTLDDPEVAPPDVHYGAEGELSWMRRDDGLTRIRIDTDDPSCQNELFEILLRHASAKRRIPETDTLNESAAPTAMQDRQAASGHQHRSPEAPGVLRI